MSLEPFALSADKRKLLEARGYIFSDEGRWFIIATLYLFARACPNAGCKARAIAERPVDKIPPDRVHCAAAAEGEPAW